MPTLELSAPFSARARQQPTPASSPPPGRRFPGATLKQLLRFGTVGCFNTVLDVSVLNGLFWLFPTRNVGLLLVENAVAYSVGAVNSFFFNKYWTFRCTGPAGRREVTCFALTTLAGIAVNSLLLWAMSSLLHPVFLSAVLWANVSKLIAIGGTVLISYLGMRLWVFISPEQATLLSPALMMNQVARGAGSLTGNQPAFSASGRLTTASLSVVLPIYNEASVIAATVQQVLKGVASQVREFELILVNDGSTDATGAILAAFTADARVRVVTHERNQGYGAALADGFAAASKTLTFFMDSDGQFDIGDLARLLPFMGEYDAVIGYRRARQDTWLRKLNAWGWKMLVRMVLGARARDIDCAFKLLRTDFLQRYPLETRGAMINAELLYKLRRAGCSCYEVGVQHYPRRGGRATGANLRVIARAFRELFFYARKWRREDIHPMMAA
jgi:putative flippase GtrA